MMILNPQCRMTKQKVPKVSGICVTYTRLQTEAVRILSERRDVTSIEVNVQHDKFVCRGRLYTTDILYETSDGYTAAECVMSSQLRRPKTIELLTESCRIWDGSRRNGKSVRWEVITDADSEKS